MIDGAVDVVVCGERHPHELLLRDEWSQYVAKLQGQFTNDDKQQTETLQKSTQAYMKLLQLLRP